MECESIKEVTSMEMERINDNLIRVFIDGDDLEERGINFLDLINDQKSIEKFFYSILEEVDVEKDFTSSDAITFQVIPNHSGMELYISRANPDDMEEFFDEAIIERLRKHKAESEEKRRAQELLDDIEAKELIDEIEEELSSTSLDSDKATDKPSSDSVKINLQDDDDRIVRFESLESFIQFAREEKTSDITGDLFTMNGVYYFVIDDLSAVEYDSTIYYTVIRMMDFAEPQPITVSLLEEHGQLIRSYDTIKYFGENF